MTDESLAEPAADAQAIRVLVIDNDEQLARVMRETLERTGYQCDVAFSGPEGARKIELEDYDIVVTDLVMNEIDGMGILSRARQLLPDCDLIMVTGHASVPKAVEAMQLGAHNFLEKPLTPQRLRAVVDKASDAVRLRRANSNLLRRLDERFGFEGIVYTSDSMKQIIERVKRIAPTDASVLIQGATGTGKELIAQAIHQNSPRRKKPFVALNCAALPEHLLESELFGHIRGAYTDAATDRVGRFEYANGGTLFLDELGDMPMSTQIKLLRVLEQGEITRVGENKPVKVNVRLLSATHRNLEEAIKDGSFRSDLYFRLKVVTIELPSLAQRREDIIPLADYFRKQLARRHSKTVRGLSPPLGKRLYNLDWPGNVRQLRNAVESMVVVDIDEILDLDDLPPEFAPSEAPHPAAAPEGPSHLLGASLEQIERWAIEETLKLCGGNKEEAARILQIGVRTLYRKLKEYQLGE